MLLYDPTRPPSRSYAHPERPQIRVVPNAYGHTLTEALWGIVQTAIAAELVLPENLLDPLQQSGERAPGARSPARIDRTHPESTPGRCARERVAHSDQSLPRQILPTPSSQARCRQIPRQRGATASVPCGRSGACASRASTDPADRERARPASRSRQIGRASCRERVYTKV